MFPQACALRSHSKTENRDRLFVMYGMNKQAGGNGHRHSMSLQSCRGSWL